MYSQKKSGYFFLPHGRPLVVGCVQYNSADYRRHIKPLFHLEPCLYVTSSRCSTSNRASTDTASSPTRITVATSSRCSTSNRASTGTTSSPTRPAASRRHIKPLFHLEPCVYGHRILSIASSRRHIKPLFHLEPCVYGHHIFSNAASGQPSPHQVAVPPRTVPLRTPHPLHRVQRICGRPTHAGAAQLPPRRTMRRTKVLAKPAVTFPAAAVSAPRCCRLKSAARMAGGMPDLRLPSQTQPHHRAYAVDGKTDKLCRAP